YMIRIFNHYLSLRVLMLTLLETMVLFQAMVLGFEIRFLNESLPLPLLPAAIFTVVVLLMMTGLGMYQAQAERFRTTIQRLVVAYGLSLMVMCLIYDLFPETCGGRGVLAVTSVFAAAGVLVVRVIFFRVTDFGLPMRRILVLGN